jgi:hypothetical protein
MIHQLLVILCAATGTGAIGATIALAACYRRAVREDKREQET